MPADTVSVRLPDSGVSAVAFNPDGKLATGDSNGNVYLWTGSQPQALPHPASGAVTAIAFTSNNKYLAAATAGGRTYIWSLATNTIVATLRDQANAGVRAVGFAPNGSYLAAGEANGNTYIYDLSYIGA